MTPSTSEQSSRASATATRSQLHPKRRKSQSLSLRKKHQQRKKLLRKSLRRRSQSKRLLMLNLRRKKLLRRLPPRSTPATTSLMSPHWYASWLTSTASTSTPLKEPVLVDVSVSRTYWLQLKAAPRPGLPHQVVDALTGPPSPLTLLSRNRFAPPPRSTASVKSALPRWWNRCTSPRS